ncbi:MAG: tRNA (adenosine(37)-N6)-dimethylallyltransferase MiaA [Firmicutes bacterium]|nr:tRNA (adenosine(37)-N6)-dimethylallyltransferase MiaA [Bacillota bacterium]
MTERKPLLCIVGPTAVGKTALALEVARSLHGEIVSADALAVYHGMRIGTAQPTAVEREGVAYHLIDFLPPDKMFSVGQYQQLAETCLQVIRQRAHLPILCGGSGLYVDAVIKRYRFAGQPASVQLRQSLQKRLETEGLEELVEDLRRRDPHTWARIDRRNPRRVLRALEVALQRPQDGQEDRYDRLRGETLPAIKIGLTLPREQLYRQIEMRVDAMIASGWLEEAERLKGHYPHLSQTAWSAIGYKELFAYLDGQLSLQEAVAKIKQRTRHLAKRQWSWFRRDPEIQWLDASDGIAACAEEIVRRFADL